jgi:Zn-dependent peptidase ImmA (M78 family)
MLTRNLLCWSRPLNHLSDSAKNLKSLQRHVTGVGLKWARVRAALPEWAEEAAAHGTGLLELEAFVARHFGLRLAAGGGYEPVELPAARFKKRTGVADEALVGASTFANAVARSVARGTVAAWKGIPNTAAGMRQLALQASGNRKWVDFASLVEASWLAGIPVIHLPEPPYATKKPDGLVTYVSGRPAIVLMKKEPMAEWMVFVLAHELGHVALGHLRQLEGATIVDEKVSRGDEGPSSTSAGQLDNEEDEANNYATGVLLPGGQQLVLTEWPKAEQLAEMALRFGEANGICPGHAVLNAVRNTSKRTGTNLFGLGNKTVRILHQTMDARTTAEVCRDAARKHLDVDAIGHDTEEFLEKLEVI